MRWPKRAQTAQPGICSYCDGQSYVRPLIGISLFWAPTGMILLKYDARVAAAQRGRDVRTLFDVYCRPAAVYEL